MPRVPRVRVGVAWGMLPRMADPSSDPPVRRVRCIVRGDVQGVWFRESVRRLAEDAGVHGTAENLADGTVAIELQGPPREVERLIEFCWVGPPAARVSGVDVLDLDAEPAEAGFVVR